jgi:hypothetical protein
MMKKEKKNDSQKKSLIKNKLYQTRENEAEHVLDSVRPGQT